jgi:hypothetical protein
MAFSRLENTLYITKRGLCRQDMRHAITISKNTIHDGRATKMDAPQRVCYR